MKKFLTMILLVALALPATASVTFYVFGNVTSLENGNPVPNQAVTLVSDSSSGFFYYHTVYTNPDGYYADTVVSPADSGLFFVQTLDCNNMLIQTQLYYSPNNLNFQTNFVICTMQCTAEFTYQPYGDSLTIEFIDLSAGNITKWKWDFGDGNTTTIEFPGYPSLFHVYGSPGTYMVCLTIQNSDSTCTDTVCHPVQVHLGPACNAGFTWYADTVSNNLGIQFIDQSQGDISLWSWSFGDGTYGYGPDPYHVYADTGVYHVCLTVQSADSTCFDTQCWEVPVINGHNCSNYFDYNVNNLTVSFAGYLNNGLPANYSWDFGDGQTAQGQSATHTYAQPGNYAVSLTTIDSMACVYVTWQSVQVGDTLTFHQIYGQVFVGSFTMNQGMVMIFSVDSTGNYFPYTDVMSIDSSGIYYFSYVPDGEYYIWAVPFTTEYLPTYYGDVLFWEDATVVVLGEPSNPYDINLIPAPGLNLGSGNINGHINSGSYKSTFTDKISMLIENEAGDVLSHAPVNASGDFDFTSLVTGTYYLLAELPGCASDKVRVDITAENPDVNVTLTMTNGKILGIGSPGSSLTSILLYPNPAREDVSLVMNAKEPVRVTFDLMNMTGKNLLSKEILLNKGETIISIPLGTVPSGVYMVRIHSDEGINVIQKLIRTK